MGRLLTHPSIVWPALIWQGASAALRAPQELMGTTEVLFVTFLDVLTIVSIFVGVWLWLSMVATGVAVSADSSNHWRVVPPMTALRVLVTVCILAVPIVGSIPLAAIPSIYLLARWQMTIPVVIEHDPGLQESMQESSQLARGYIPQIIVLWLAFGAAAWFSHSWITTELPHVGSTRFAADRLWTLVFGVGSALLLASIYAELTTIDLEVHR
jgi:hypothetical protein